MPAKIALAGENTFKIYFRRCSEALIIPRVETYQTDAARDSSRKCVQDIHSWVEPLCQSFVATASLVEFVNLILKDSKNGGGRVA